MPVWLALLLSLAPQEAATAYRGARLHTGEGAPLERGTLLVRGRVIEAVGVDVPLPDGAKVVDLGGKIVLPGLIDAASRAFLDPADRVAGSPDQDVADAFDFFRFPERELRARGVTTVYVAPVGAGLGAAVRLSARPSLLKRQLALHLSIARGGEISTASARYEAYRQMVQLFEGAKSYREAWSKYEKDRKDVEAKRAAGDKSAKDPAKPARDPAKETLARALDGTLPVRMEAQCADSIGYALRLAEEFKLKLTLEGGAEAYERAEDLAKAKTAVVVGPVLRYGPPSAETLRQSPACPAALVKAGVPVVALGSFGRDAGASRFLLEAAGEAASRGLDRERALEAVTIGAARALGLDAEIGSLKKGKRADFVVLSGDPFDARTVVERTVVDGAAVYERSAP